MDRIKYPIIFAPTASARARLRPRKAMVLVVVLIVVTIVALASFSFAELMYVEEKAVRLHGDELQLEHVVGSAEAYLKTFLRQPKLEQQEAGGAENNPDLFQAIRLADEKSAPGQARFSIVSPLLEGDRAVGVRFGLENESSRLNLAAVALWEKTQPGSGQRALMALPGMTQSTAGSILDWLDSDSQNRELGAELDYYANLEPPYAPRNALVNSLEELLLVKGVSRQLLWGTNVNYNHLDEDDEKRLAQPVVNSLKETIPEDHQPWASLLTLYSGEKNANSQGQPRINLNNNNLPELHQQLAEEFDRQWADFIIAYRQFGPYKGNRSGNSAAGFQVDLTTAARFNLSTLLDLLDAKVRTTKVGDRKSVVINSPWKNDRSSLQDQFWKLLDHATVSELEFIPGRININQAPRAVLSGIPTMDDALVEQIVLNRDSLKTQDLQQKRHAAWLLAEELVDLPTMKQLMPYLTAGGDVYRAQIVGFFDQHGPAARVEIVLDATSTPPRRVYWKDLRTWGRGYSLEMLGAEPTRVTPRNQNTEPTPADPLSRRSSQVRDDDAG